jgi:GTP cyclohydrolase IA
MSMLRAEIDDQHRRPQAIRAGLEIVPSDKQEPVYHSPAEQAVADLLLALGADPSREGLRETPRRVAAALAAMITPVPFEMTTFSNDEAYDELITVCDIPFHSLCEHHMLPFIGVAHVGYIPGKKLVGLSKIARAVVHFASGLQVQERMTSQIAQCLNDHLAPKGVGVVLQAEHLCMSLRGVSANGTKTVTSALFGAIRDDARTRQEFFTMAGIGGQAR